MWNYNWFYVYNINLITMPDYKGRIKRKEEEETKKRLQKISICFIELIKFVNS